jgi:hypothetical protein
LTVELAWWMPETVVVDAPAAAAVDIPVVITVVMTGIPVAISATVLTALGTAGTTGASAVDLALGHLPWFIHRRPFTTILAPVLIIARILPVSTIPVFPSLSSTTARMTNCNKLARI